LTFSKRRWYSHWWPIFKASKNNENWIQQSVWSWCTYLYEQSRPRLLKVSVQTLVLILIDIEAKQIGDANVFETKGIANAFLRLLTCLSVSAFEYSHR
jgi:hypothetical protein